MAAYSRDEDLDDSVEFSRVSQKYRTVLGTRVTEEIAEDLINAAQDSW